jgi:hypothetical protein
LLGFEDFRPALDLAGGERVVSAALGQEPQTAGSAASFDVGDQARPLQVGEDLLGAAELRSGKWIERTRAVERMWMLAQRGKHLGSRLGQPQPRCRLPTHADLQARDRLAARRCGASAEPVRIVCGSGVAGTKAIPVAEVMQKRCRASAEVVAKSSSARDEKKIEGGMRTTPAALMF